MSDHNDRGARHSSVLLWGSVATGKSGVLGALYDLGLAQSPRPVWSLSPGDAPPLVTEHLVSLRNGLLEGASNPTAILPQYPTLELMVRKRKNGRTSARLPLSFVDPAGEFADNVQRLRDSGSELLERMLAARGIIWLFDATRPGVDHDAVFGQLTTLTGLTGGDLVKTPIALCLSKIDLLDPYEQARALGNPEQALRRHIGDDIYHLFSCVFPNRQCFAISSRGSTRGAIRPVGLNEVFDWIYDREQRREFRDKVARGQMRALKIVAGVAVLSLGVWGGTSAYGEMKSNNERRELEQLGRLERAGAEYRDGNLEQVVSLLAGDGLSQKHARSLEWDTLFTFAATEIGLEHHAAGSGGQSFLTQAMARANRALEHDLLGVQAESRIRFYRAQACGVLQCGRARQREDLQYVVSNTKDRGLRRRANDALRELQ
jgi:hypothetical protein